MDLKKTQSSLNDYASIIERYFIPCYATMWKCCFMQACGTALKPWELSGSIFIGTRTKV